MAKEAHTRSIRVLEGDAEQEWLLRWQDPAHGDDFIVGLLASDGRSWTARGHNMFATLIELRRQLDPLNIKLCCQGARTQAAISGMAADMGRGMMVYRIEHGRPARQADLVDVFVPAPPEEIGTVEEQAAYRRAWMS
ncbi:MAG: hypothetical protein AAF547_07585 [Actinomycetota bacterium]